MSSVERALGTGNCCSSFTLLGNLYNIIKYKQVEADYKSLMGHNFCSEGWIELKLCFSESPEKALKNGMFKSKLLKWPNFGMFTHL